MIYQTPQQRANTLEALNVMWPSVPPENVSKDLNYWRVGDFGAPNCGSVACFGGWLPWWPEFARQGVYAGENGCPLAPIGPEGISSYLFGRGSLLASFRGAHFADKKFKGSDHELVTYRLQWLLANSEVRA